MSKHAISVEIIIESETLKDARDTVNDLLFSVCYEQNKIFHYKIQNGDEGL